MPTVHISAEKDDIAETVLMPGDPLRAKFIAENFLEDVTCFNKIRNILGYTGFYKNRKISVMGSGMGMPSIGIYSYELYNFYNVKNIIRIGTAGGFDEENINLKDIVFAMGACSDSNYIKQFNLSGNFSAIASFGLLNKAVNSARKKKIKFSVGNVLSSDIFYSENKESFNNWKKMGIIAVEMEAAALYINAARYNKNALCILSISNLIFNDKNELTSEEREKSLVNMIEIALDIF